MSGNGNGTKITLWIFASIVFPILFFMGTNTIANDKCRQEEDKAIRREMSDDRQIQQKVNENILISLAEMKTDLRYIKEKVR